MSGSPRQEQLDERFARHLRESRADEIAGTPAADAGPYVPFAEGVSGGTPEELLSSESWTPPTLDGGFSVTPKTGMMVFKFGAKLRCDGRIRFEARLALGDYGDPMEQRHPMGSYDHPEIWWPRIALGDDSLWSVSWTWMAELIEGDNMWPEWRGYSGPPLSADPLYVDSWLLEAIGPVEVPL